MVAVTCNECRADRIETALRGIIDHWRKFGDTMVFGDNRDDYGLDERIDEAAKLLK